MTPEGRVKVKVKALLKRHKIYYHMPVMNGMGSPTLDFICCVNGRFFAIETKAPGKKPTPRQEVTMKQMADSGAFVFVVTNDDELCTLSAYLELMV